MQEAEASDRKRHSGWAGPNGWDDPMGAFQERSAVNPRENGCIHAPVLTACPASGKPNEFSVRTIGLPAICVPTRFTGARA